MTNDDMDSVFHALAHRIRRQIMDIVRDRPGVRVGELAQSFDVTRIAVMNHLGVLTDAELIVSEREGRSRRLYLNAMPIQEIHERWTDMYSEYWLDRMSFIKSTAEVIAQQLTDRDELTQPTAAKRAKRARRKK